MTEVLPCRRGIVEGLAAGRRQRAEQQREEVLVVAPGPAQLDEFRRPESGDAAQGRAGHQSPRVPDEAFRCRDSDRSSVPEPLSGGVPGSRVRVRAVVSGSAVPVGPGRAAGGLQRWPRRCPRCAATRARATVRAVRRADARPRRAPGPGSGGPGHASAPRPEKALGAVAPRLRLRTPAAAALPPRLPTLRVRTRAAAPRGRYVHRRRRRWRDAGVRLRGRRPSLVRGRHR